MSKKSLGINISVWVLVCILYFQVFFKLYTSAWAIRDYTHAYFVLPLSLIFIWQKHNKIKSEACNLQPTAAFFGFITLCLGLLMFFFGWQWEYLLISTLSFIIVIVGIVLFLYGPKILKRIRFALFYLLLMVPPPTGMLDNITIPMRYGVSVAAHAILKVFGYAFSREGLILSIGTNEIYMGAPCSGFRSLITLFALGLAYVHLIKITHRQRLIMILCIIPLALLGNLIRVISMCLVTFYLGATTGQKYFHDYSGIIIFLLLILGLLGIEKLLDHMFRDRFDGT